MTVRIEFTPAMARYIERLQRRPGDKLEEHGDGRVTLTMTVCNTIDVQNWVIRYGEHVVVPESARLQAQLAELTERTTAAYA